MEHLFTKAPMLRSISSKSVSDFRNNLINVASRFEIATGFISNESIVELQRIVDIRQGDLSVDLFVGMNYIEGFTELQYNTLKDLDSFLKDNGAGKVYVSPRALFHGKLYSFTSSDNTCMGSFIGSSNLSSFMGTTQNTIEADLFLPGNEGLPIYKNIKKVIADLGTEFSLADPITQFLPKENDLLKGHEKVERLSDDEFSAAMSKLTGVRVEVPLKTEEKSNLNTYFGAGKVKGRYSPRSWYEVELIVPKNTPNVANLPDKDAGPFRVITPSHYTFMCERQGDYSKNLRSSGDLRILGKWIKGEMEAKGAIRCGQKVTEDTLRRFGKSKIVFTKSSEDFWFINLE